MVAAFCNIQQSVESKRQSLDFYRSKIITICLEEKIKNQPTCYPDKINSPKKRGIKGMAGYREN